MAISAKPALIATRKPDLPVYRPIATIFLGRPVTWKEVTALQPKLKELLSRARRFHRYTGSYFCANAAWYGAQSGYDGHPGLKPELEELVGWYAGTRNRVLRSAEAYDIAYGTIYDALPDCDEVCECQFGPGIIEPFSDADPVGVRQAWNRMQRHVGPLVFERDGDRCLGCGSTENLTVDHIIPIDAGGKNTLDNLQSLCRFCNSRKGVKVQHDR